MTNKLLRIQSVIDMTGKSRSAIYADMAKGSFPISISLSPRSVAWVESDIASWIQSKIDESRPKPELKKTSNPYQIGSIEHWDSLSKREQELEIKQCRLKGEMHFSDI